MPTTCTSRGRAQPHKIQHELSISYAFSQVNVVFSSQRSSTWVGPCLSIFIPEISARQINILSTLRTEDRLGFGTNRENNKGNKICEQCESRIDSTRGNSAGLLVADLEVEVLDCADIAKGGRSKQKISQALANKRRKQEEGKEPFHAGNVAEKALKEEKEHDRSAAHGGDGSTSPRGTLGTIVGLTIGISHALIRSRRVGETIQASGVRRLKGTTLFGEEGPASLHTFFAAIFANETIAADGGTTLLGRGSTLNGTVSIGTASGIITLIFLRRRHGGFNLLIDAGLFIAVAKIRGIDLASIFHACDLACNSVGVARLESFVTHGDEVHEVAACSGHRRQDERSQQHDEKKPSAPLKTKVDDDRWR